ncbi:hypothetical protein evm_007589 [Chilo suppressalis]|nr:hypothetical protein evm_007589 [Chilo suppressalis]
MPDIQIRQRDVRAELQSLDVRKASGPDGIPAVVLKHCAAELSPVLTRLYQLSYSLGRVPAAWRDASVQPVPKKGDRSDPANYRPIAVTSVLCKVLERVLNNHLTLYLEDYSLIHDRQYGFRPNRSTGDLLAYVTHIWGEATDKRGESLAISLDIAKAFDRVWHESLLSKLPAYGLPAQLCAWVADFLHERRFRVLTDGCSSQFMSVNAGVPQGSVLSPTLFLLHINDLIPLVNILCYADDSTVHARYFGHAAAGQVETMEKRENLVVELNRALDHISEWGTRNLVEFNAKKTQACAFTAKTSPFLPLPSLQGTTLALQSYITMLGMKVRSDLNPKDYIETLIKAASRKLGVLNKRACTRSRRAAARCGPGPGCWALLARLQRLQPDVERALQPASPAPYTAIMQACQTHCLQWAEEWVEGVRGDGAGAAVDGTVHQLAAAALGHCHHLAHLAHCMGPALATDPNYARAAAQLPASHDRNATLLAIYMRKVLAQLNFTLRNKSEQYPDALKAIFLLNNTHYLLQGLQRSGLLDVVSLAEPECEASYRDLINHHRQAYLQSSPSQESKIGIVILEALGLPYSEAMGTPLMF